MEFARGRSAARASAKESSSPALRRLRLRSASRILQVIPVRDLKPSSIRTLELFVEARIRAFVAGSSILDEGLRTGVDLSVRLGSSFFRIGFRKDATGSFFLRFIHVISFHVSRMHTERGGGLSCTPWGG